MRTLLVALGLLGSLFTHACAVDVCAPRPSPCPNDPENSPAYVSQCRDREAMSVTDPCRTAFHNAANCAYRSVQCTADGRTDPLVTLRNVGNNCRTESEQIAQCCAANRTSAYCGGTGP